MRHGMYAVTAVMAGLCVVLAAAPAAAQYNDVILVAENTPYDTSSNLPPVGKEWWAEVPTAQQFDDLDAAITYAKTIDSSARVITVRVTARIDGEASLAEDAAWSVSSIGLDATDYIRIEGSADAKLVSGALMDGPARVIIQGSAGNPVFELTDASSAVLIGKLTATGGSVGIQLSGTSQATISRCHIRDNTSHGILCTGNPADPENCRSLVVNCMIKNNGGHGIRVEDEAILTVVFCTIFDNGTVAGNNAGVYVADTKDSTDPDPEEDAEAHVRNTLVYRNPADAADTTGWRGLVWTVESALYWTAAASYTAYNSVYDVAYTNVQFTYDALVNPLDAGTPLVKEGAGYQDFEEGKLISAAVGLINEGDPDMRNVDQLVYLPDALRARIRQEGLFLTDLEGERRPYPSTQRPDIGADEVVAVGAALWDYVSIVPEPLDPYVPPYFVSASGTVHAGVGPLDAGQVSIYVGFRGSLLDDIAALDPLIYLVPQGTAWQGTPSDTHDWHIAFPAPQYLGDGLFVARNALPITTVVNYPLGDLDSSASPTQGDIVSDGHAAVFVWLTSDLPDPPIDTETEASEQVRVYRHCLIDTTPPRMSIPATGVGAKDLVDLMSDDPVLYPAHGHNDSGMFGALGLNALLHPYAFPIDGANPYWPVTPFPPADRKDFVADAGVIMDRPGETNGAQALFNVGSISNNQPSGPINNSPPIPGLDDGLDVDITVEFVDEPPRDAQTEALIEGVIAGNTNLDLFTNYTIRQVVGFPWDPLDPAAVFMFPDPADPNPGYDAGPARWQFVEGTFSSLPSGVDVMYTTQAGLENPGYDFGNPSADAYGASSVVPMLNGSMLARWWFEQGDPADQSDDGLPWTGAEAHLAMKFIARDLAGNSTFREAESGVPDWLLALDPLHLWWMLKARVDVSQDEHGNKVNLSKLRFDWQLRREAADPMPEGQPKPRYTWRLWVSDETTYGPAPDYEDNGWQGPYLPVIPWAPWTETSQLTAAYFSDAAIAPLITGKWVLMVVSGVDEAGNVEPWPWDDLTLNVGDEVTPVTSGPGLNWQWFYVEDQGDCNTAVSVEFFHVDPGGIEYSLGSNRLVPMPPDDPPGWGLVARFRVTPVYDRAYIDPNDVTIEWVLSGPSGSTSPPPIAGPLPPNQPVPVEAWAGTDLPDLPVAPPGQPNAVPYVFQARMASPTCVDATPATVQFTLIHGSATDYVTPRDSRGAQPFKYMNRE